MLKVVLGKHLLWKKRG